MGYIGVVLVGHLMCYFLFFAHICKYSNDWPSDTVNEIFQYSIGWSSDVLLSHQAFSTPTYLKYSNDWQSLYSVEVR